MVHRLLQNDMIKVNNAVPRPRTSVVYSYLKITLLNRDLIVDIRTSTFVVTRTVQVTLQLQIGSNLYYLTVLWGLDQFNWLHLY